MLRKCIVIYNCCSIIIYGIERGEADYMTQEKKNAGIEGEACQRENCQKNFSNAHIMRNGYTYTNRVLIIKASHYMKKGKL